jgi:hypothetical protein
MLLQPLKLLLLGSQVLLAATHAKVSNGWPPGPTGRKMAN